MKTLTFYFVLMTPMLFLILFIKLALISSGTFVFLLMFYCLVYHPTVVALRLLDKQVITKADFAKTYIPFWNRRYFTETFF